MSLHAIRGEAMPRKTMKVKQTLQSDDVLDLGAAQHRVGSIRDYGRAENIWRDIRFPAVWAASAFFALGLVVYTSTTNRGGERLAALPGALGELIGQAQGPSPSQLASIVNQEVDTVREETRRLIAERARLEQRLARLERDVDDVTGSTRRGNDVTGSIAPSEPRVAARDSAPLSLPAARDGGRPSELPIARSGQGSADNDLASASGGITLATRSQFGLDLGSENTMTALRLRWQRLSERNKAALARLEPLVAIRDGINGQPVLYLVAGPLNDVADAAALCAQLRQLNVNCQPTVYDGQRLALR